MNEQARKKETFAWEILPHPHSTALLCTVQYLYARCNDRETLNLDKKNVKELFFVKGHFCWKHTQMYHKLVAFTKLPDL